MAIINELFALCKTVLDKATSLVPYSSNHNPDLSPDEVKHRQLWLKAIRVKDIHGDVAKLRSYHLDITPPSCDVNFGQLRIKLNFFGSRPNPTINEWLNYLATLPPRRTIQGKQKKNGQVLSYPETLENMAKAAVRAGIGNCAELTALAFVLLLESDWDLPKQIKVETARLFRDNHNFVIVGRDENSDLNDMSTWGESAMILDVWMGEVVHVNTELAKIYEGVRSDSYCFNYIFAREKCIRLINDYPAYVGGGHTQHWHEQRQKKNEPVLLSDWTPVRNDDTTENMPWLKRSRDDEDKLGESYKKRCAGP